MQKCFLVINKDTQVASYLEHRSILQVTEEHRSLSELDLQRIDIVDVDKLLYIYYQTDDMDLSFRSDMNALRNLMASAFFHTSELLFILVNNTNPLMEDLIHSALRDAPISNDKVEIITHNGPLMLADVGKYLSGSAAGQITSSSYRDVYVREADKEEKERFVNTRSELGSVLPVLTDMAALYQQRAGVEAISAGRVVTESSTRPSLVKDFTRVSVESAKTMVSFVVSGERWSNSEKAVGYLVQYQHIAGKRSLIVNFDKSYSLGEIVGPCTLLTLMDIKVPVTPELPVAILDARLNQLGYIVEFLQNIKGVEEYIFYCAAEDYRTVSMLIHQLSEVTYDVFVAHYSEESIKCFLEGGNKATALFLCSSKFSEEFNLKAYKEDLRGCVVAEFPMDEVDYTEFREFAEGGMQHE